MPGDTNGDVPRLLELLKNSGRLPSFEDLQRQLSEPDPPKTEELRAELEALRAQADAAGAARNSVSIRYTQDVPAFRVKGADIVVDPELLCPIPTRIADGTFVNRRFLSGLHPRTMVIEKHLITDAASGVIALMLEGHGVPRYYGAEPFVYERTPDAAQVFGPDPRPAAGMVMRMFDLLQRLPAEWIDAFIVEPESASSCGWVVHSAQRFTDAHWYRNEVVQETP